MYSNKNCSRQLFFSKCKEKAVALIIGHLRWPLRPQLRPLIGPERPTSSGREREARCTSTAGDEREKESKYNKICLLDGKIK